MKKTVKFFSLFLALVMMLQVAPLAAVSVSAEPNENGNIEIVPPFENDSSVTVTAMEWRDATQGVELSPLTDGMTIDCNYVLVCITLSDLPDAAKVEVDGTPVWTLIYEKKNQVLTYVELVNGLHRFDFTMYYGSETFVKSFYVNVEGADPAYPSISVENSATVVLGGEGELIVKGSNLDAVGEILVDMSMSAGIKVKSVDISKGLTGTYSWYRGELKLNLEVYNASRIEDDVLAVIRFTTPKGMTAATELNWTLNSMVVYPAEGETLGNPAYEGDFVGSVTQPTTEIPVTGGYNVSIDGEAAVGNISQTIIVTDPEGNPVAGVPVYGIDENGENVLLGVTDENGEIVTDFFNGKGSYEIFVEDEKGISSFVETIYCYETVGPEDGSPYAFIFGVGESAPNSKTFTWMSNMASTKDVAQVIISTSPDMSDATTYTGTSEVQYYHTSEVANRINTVTVTDLTPGVYYYQVGDGETWSEVMAFTVKEPTDDVSFGFTSANSASELSLIAGATTDNGLDVNFTVQTGNVVSDVNDYDSWMDALDAYAELGNVDVIHAQSRDDNNGDELLNNSAPYSFYTYNNVYVGVINYTEDAEVLKASLSDMNWDAQQQDYAWRILVVNRSPETTDTALADSNAADLISTMAMYGGIDLVVSDDCNEYARTEPLFDGKAAHINGATYLFYGSKNETPVELKGDFAKTSSDYNCLYISFTANEDQMTVTVYDVLADGTTEVVDAFVKTRASCHDDEHKYRFGLNPLYLICDYCGHRIRLGEYTGLIALDNKYMYILDDNFAGGWKTQNGNVYYFDLKTFISFDGVQTINGFTFVFENDVLVEGAWVNTAAGKKLLWGDSFLTDTWHTQGGKTYYFFADGVCATGTVDITYENENGQTVTETFIFDENGALIG